MQKTLKNNLRVGLGLSLLLLFISSLASYVSITYLVKSSKLVTHSNEIINNLEEIISTLKDAETGQRGYLLTGDKLFLDPYTGAKSRAIAILRGIEVKTADNPIQQQNLKRLAVIIENRLDVIQRTIVIKEAGATVSVGDLLAGKVYMDEARNLIQIMETNEKDLLATRTSDEARLSGYTPVLIILAALISIFITVFFYRRVSSDFSARVRLQGELEQKNAEIETRIHEIQSVAAQISSGNYEIRMTEQAKDGLGILAESLNSMAESLRYSFSLLGDKEWLQSGIASLNVQMVGEKSIEVLANDIMENIIKHTEANVAAFYLLEENRTLHLIGSYALLEEEIRSRVELGEGLVGQAAKSGMPMLLNDIPNDELTISYAAGNIKPRNIVALPIIRDHLTVGVIEVGSLNAFTPLQLDFLNGITHNIGIAIHVTENRKKLQDFLEETQAQTEELQAQHTELEGLNAELEAQTQKIQTSEEELRVQQEELLQSNQELEERTTLLEEKNQLIQEHNEEIQRKSEQLAQSTKYKSEFLANMSHELRTPLNSILLLSKLMSDNQDLDPEYVEYAEVIQSSGQGLLGLIDEILDLSKIEAGKMKLEQTDVLLAEVATDMKLLFNPIAKNKGLELVIAFDDQMQAIYTDKMRLEQILKNLLSNAIKFTAKGSVSLLIKGNPEDDQMAFSVTDTGIGIPLDKQNLVFEAFQQADGSTRRRFGGTGLGLSISRELAKLLGGEISLSSEEHKGSTFSLTIPIKGASPDAEVISNRKEYIKETTVPVPPVAHTDRFIVDRIPQDIEDDRNNINAGDKVILIIEDDTAFAKTLLNFTRKKNYKCIVAVRGDVGIELANYYLPQAILLDIQLPVKDGWQVMEELKSNSATRHIPVHIMSSLEVKKESLMKGAVDFINKPVALEHLQQIFQKLEKALSHHPKKVLIVEENRQHAEALSFFLSNYNIQTEVVDEVTKGIDILQNEKVDCVILDMGVPDKNAYLTLEMIKKSEGLENLPIIIFTGKSMSKGEEQRIKQYADSIVVKTAHSYQRILDEAALFLHLVEEKSDDNKNAKAIEGLRGLYEVLSGKTVLIADDDVRNIFSLTKALEQHKMKVLAATDGKDALQVLKDNPGVDVVLMDMMMPEMDGYESTKEIRKIKEFKHLPILAVTAKAMMGDREKCIAAGASDYISKPVDVDQLLSLLRVWLYDKI